MKAQGFTKQGYNDGVAPHTIKRGAQMIDNHFTTTGVVINSRNEILMIHHNKLQVWLPPGGHIEDNELPDEAVLREIYEETGIRAKIIDNKKKLSLKSEYCRQLETPFVVLLEDIEANGRHNHIDLIYLCQATHEELVPQENEVDGIGWFTFEQIKELDTYDNVIKTITLAVEHMNLKKE